LGGLPKGKEKMPSKPITKGKEYQYGRVLDCDSCIINSYGPPLLSLQVIIAGLVAMILDVFV